MSEHWPDDPGRRAILQALERNEVRYVVIGGAAAQARGWPEQTNDLDITPERSQENLGRLANAVEELGGAFRIDPDRYPDGFRPPGGFDWRTFKGQVWVAFATDHGDLDVVLVPDGTRGYEDMAWSATRERVPGAGIAVPVASAEMIIRSKEAADRAKDHAVLDRMREVLDPWRRTGRSDPPER